MVQDTSLVGSQHTYIQGGRATDRPFNRPTDQRNWVDNFSMIPSDRIENSARDVTIYFFSTDFFNCFTWNLSAHSPLTYSSRSTWHPSLPSRNARPPLCRPNLTQRRNTMILKLIPSNSTYNFEISFVAMIYYWKTRIGQKTILSVERSVRLFATIFRRKKDSFDNMYIKLKPYIFYSAIWFIQVLACNGIQWHL